MVSGVIVDSMDELTVLNSQDMNVIYDFNNDGKINAEHKTPLSLNGVQSGVRNDTLARLGRQVDPGRLGHA